MKRLHRRLAALLALIAVLAFVSGAGLEAPALIPAGVVLLLAIFIQPGAGALRLLEPVWRVAALLLAARAAVRIGYGGGDPVLPMVDLLLLLLTAESLRMRDGSGDARHFALTFALLIAAAAYRPGLAFGLLFVAYVVCAVLVLTVGHLDRQAAARHVRAAAPGPAFLVRMGALSLVVLAVSGLVFLFFPRASQGWAARSRPLVATASVGFSDRVSIGDHGATIESNPAVVLRVEFPEGAPPNVGSLHWRGRAYDRFDGVSWSRSERPLSPLREAERWQAPRIEQLIYGRPLGDANVIFGLHPIAAVQPESRIRPVRTAGGDYLYYGEADPVYRVRSLLGTPPADSLRQVRMEYSSDVLSHLQLPARQLPPVLSARLLALADSFSAATTNVYDHALAIEQWLRTFEYTLDLPETAEQATLDHFLFERRAGHCEYFSTAMAVLLRAGGVPARNVNGFLGGEWNEFGGFLTVTQNNAHSWVEVFFPGWGWVPFDPTPAGGAPGAAARSGRMLPLRQLLQGFEHRWDKWVLDYDVGTQSDLLDRLARPFNEPADEPGAAPSADTPGRLPRALLVLAASAIALALLMAGWNAYRTRHPAATAAYLRLRRAYARAGFAPADQLSPVAFSNVIADAPGAAAARRAVQLYLEARFGGRQEPGSVDELRERVRAAQAELRKSRR